jgi:hypothetical protein
MLGIGLSASSLHAAAQTSKYYRGGLEDLRELSDLILKEPTRTFWGDLWMVEHVKIFSRYKAANIAVVTAAESAATMQNACLVVGGSRGVELLSDYVLSTLPEFAKDAWQRESGPREATLVWRRIGYRNGQRLHDMRVYCFW